MTPDQLVDVGKAWGPLGIIAWLMLQAWARRVPDSMSEHETTAIDKLRTDLMEEFKDLRTQMGDVRDRVSRIEGAIGKGNK